MKTAHAAKKVCHPNTIFIGGLPLDTSRAELLEYLQAFDQVVDLDLAKDRKTGELKGFAKAALKTSAGVDRLIEMPVHRIRGLEIGIKRWTNKSEYLKGKDQVSKRKLYARYHPSYTKHDLIFHFSIFGNVVAVDEKIDHFTGKPRNFAYVIFEKEEEARNAALYGVIADKSQYIYCELTTPSYLMSIDSKASPCISPTFHDPTKSTKQVTLQSFDRLEGNYFKIESLNFDEYGKNDASISGRIRNRGNNIATKQKLKNLGSHQVLINPADLQPMQRGIKTCQDLVQNINHTLKPTSSLYSRRVDSNHFKENLLFLGPSRDRPLARLVLR